MPNISNWPWAEFELRENRVEYTSDSVSLKRNRRSKGILRYEATLTTIDMEFKQGRSLKAQMSRGKEKNELFSFIHPRYSYSAGVEPASGIQVVTATLAGSDSIPFTSANPWQLMAGDILQFSNDTKVYEVATDTLLQSGIQSVELTSGIRNVPIPSSDVTVNGVPFFFDIDGSIQISTEAVENQDIQLVARFVERL